MMEARARQQAKYDQAAKDLEEKMKNEPPPKLGPISKQIADQEKVKAKLRPGNPIKKDLCIYTNYAVAYLARVLWVL